MKKVILFVTMAMLISAGATAQDQLQTKLKTKDQIRDKDRSM